MFSPDKKTVEPSLGESPPELAILAYKASKIAEIRLLTEDKSNASSKTELANIVRQLCFKHQDQDASLSSGMGSFRRNQDLTPVINFTAQSLQVRGLIFVQQTIPSNRAPFSVTNSIGLLRDSVDAQLSSHYVKLLGSCTSKEEFFKVLEYINQLFCAH